MASASAAAASGPERGDEPMPAAEEDTNHIQDLIEIIAPGLEEILDESKNVFWY